MHTCSLFVRNLHRALFLQVLLSLFCLLHDELILSHRRHKKSLNLPIQPRHLNRRLARQNPILILAFHRLKLMRFYKTQKSSNELEPSINLQSILYTLVTMHQP